MNPNWDRWIFATMSDSFITAFTPLNVDLFIEGTSKKRPVELELLEFRMDGPQQRKVSRNYFVLDVEINILIRSHMDHTDYHKLRNLTGQVKDWLGQDHCTFRYGDGIDDDDTLLGTLIFKNRHLSQRMRTNHFGQVDPLYMMEESTVEASFEMHLTGE